MDTNNPYKSYGHISITPQMLRTTVKKLQLRRAYVPLNLISEYFRRAYPVQRNIIKFNEDLEKRLDCAVRVGLLLKHGENAYYLPTLREEANALKAAFTAFWEAYKNYTKICAVPPRNQNKNCSMTKRKYRNVKFNKSNNK